MRKNSFLKSLACYSATLGPTGFSIKAPGTCGSLLALILVLPLVSLNVMWKLVILGSVLVLSLICVSVYLKEKSVKHDPQEVVLDELLGQWSICLFIPLTATNFILAFILFRLFDILKPWPVSWFDSLSEKHNHAAQVAGVVLDDLVAGILALGCFYAFKENALQLFHLL